jgi:hypothetical protein
MKILPALSLALLSTASATGSGALVSRTNAGSVQKKSAPVTDDALAGQVRLKLAADPVVKGGDIQVTVLDGVVTLQGPVETSRAKDRAVSVAKRVRGVKSVINQLVVATRPGKAGVRSKETDGSRAMTSRPRPASRPAWTSNLIREWSAAWQKMSGRCKATARLVIARHE